MSLFISVRR